MKKDVPFVVKIKVQRDPESLEGFFLFRFNKMIEDGHNFPLHDFNLYCAILLRKVGLENLPESFKNYIVQHNEIRPEIQFHKTLLALELEENIPDNEMSIHLKARLKRAIDRMRIVKTEIKRVGINPNKLTLDNSKDYRELLNVIQEFDDITLMDWFIPIVLKFERFVYIYVKHVEETKFAAGQFKARSFFDYKHTEILTLIKKILKQEEESIQEHFLDVAIGNTLKDNSKIKDYHRGFKKFSPIILGGDKFSLSIDKHGFIQKFYQIK